MSPLSSPTFHCAITRNIVGGLVCCISFSYGIVFDTCQDILLMQNGKSHASEGTLFASISSEHSILSHLKFKFSYLFARIHPPRRVFYNNIFQISFVCVSSAITCANKSLWRLHVSEDHIDFRTFFVERRRSNFQC